MIGESIDDFALEIQKMTEIFEFKYFQDEALSVKFNKAVEMACHIKQATESASKIARDEHEVYKVVQGRQNKAKHYCFTRGEQEHIRRSCPLRHYISKYCRIKGPVEKACGKKNSNHSVEAFKIDSGSLVAFISNGVARSITYNIKTSRHTFISFTRHNLVHIWKSPIDVCKVDKELHFRVFVTEKCPNVLGREWFSHFVDAEDFVVKHITASADAVFRWARFSQRSKRKSSYFWKPRTYFFKPRHLSLYKKGIFDELLDDGVVYADISLMHRLISIHGTSLVLCLLHLATRRGNKNKNKQKITSNDYVLRDSTEKLRYGLNNFNTLDISTISYAEVKVFLSDYHMEIISFLGERFNFQNRQRKLEETGLGSICANDKEQTHSGGIVYSHNDHNMKFQEARKVENSLGGGEKQKSTRHQKWGDCPAKQSKCLAYVLKGHFARICVKSGKVRIMQQAVIQLNRKIDGSDSVSASDISADMGESWFPGNCGSTNIRGYGNFNLPNIGKTLVDVELNSKVLQLPLTITEEDDTPICGLDWNHKLEITHLYLSSFKCEDANPINFIPRMFPFAIRGSVINEINRLVKNDILRICGISNDGYGLSSPIVNILKSDVTKNKYIKNDPFPKFEEIISSLSGGQKFRVLDLKDAYLQLYVDEETKRYLHLSTHMRFYQFQRIPFGISWAPAIFQQYIIIAGPDDETHLKTLELVFEPLNIFGVNIKKNKCRFLENNVNYLGHIIEKEGIHPSENNHESIGFQPSPKNLKEFNSFLEAISYYARFTPMLQDQSSSFYELTKKNVKWIWTEHHEKLYKSLKGMLTFQTHNTGVERPISFASRVLSVSEKNYSTIEKEALAIMFEVKAHTTMGSPSKGGVDNSLADSLSKLPLAHERSNKHLIKIKKQDDVILKAVKRFIKGGWPDNHKIPTKLAPYYKNKDYISVEEDILMFNDRVIIPSTLRQKKVPCFHSSHVEIVAMKSLDRYYVWWPKLNEDFEEMVKTCVPCQQNRQNVCETAISPWNNNGTFWYSIHFEIHNA
ncbi:hypothetical protein RF11_03821 [Thelohanellus kitauei]|uniref:Uncharacterized protein n=1 Tax=Thelohanellus kitauei TaxID=669202 RepID=A0A0C2JHX6_THEKT|nr:hypothetical protein RF11_03821 [Thelohanellus kitauei]